HAADDVVTFQMIEKPGDVRRIVLEVGVEGYDEAAAGRPEARGEGRRLPGVARQADDSYRRVLYLEPAERFQAAVRAAVVDEDHLAGPAEGARTEAWKRSAGSRYKTLRYES